MDLFLFKEVLENRLSDDLSGRHLNNLLSSYNPVNSWLDNVLVILDPVLQFIEPHLSVSGPHLSLINESVVHLIGVGSEDLGSVPLSLNRGSGLGLVVDVS